LELQLLHGTKLDILRLNHESYCKIPSKINFTIDCPKSPKTTFWCCCPLGVIATFHQNFNSLGQEITKMIFSRHFEVSQDWAIETYHKTPL
jgi:hypothetical protein